jgi:hypothetical protein
MTEFEQKKWIAETDKLQAQLHKLLQENVKLAHESLNIKKKSKWF